MKRLFTLTMMLLLAFSAYPQSPRKLSYQAIVRNAQGKLIQSASVGIRFSILQGSENGTLVYSETFTPSTNVNGLVTVMIGTGVTSYHFDSINWADGPWYLKTETDPAGGTNYTISGVSQFVSTPYAFYALQSAKADSASFAEKANVDGSETRVIAGTHIQVAGNGTIANPYVISTGGYPLNNTITLTTSQSWQVPVSVSKIKVELWGASGGGGGSGAYSYSYNLNDGGDGGSGGFARQWFDVLPSQQFDVVIGAAGTAGVNAKPSGPGWYGDTGGGDGGDSWFGPIKAEGGKGGKKGSYASSTVHGAAGTANVGPVTGYAGVSNSAILDVWQGIERSYLGDRILTSKPGKGGTVAGYSSGTPPKPGEGGCAVITFFE